MRINVGLTSVLATAILLCSGCSETATPTPPATAGPTWTTGPAWIVDHTTISNAPDTTATTYTAYCAPAIEWGPNGTTDPGALWEVSITEAQFRRLHSGDACPGK